MKTETKALRLAALLAGLFITLGTTSFAAETKKEAAHVEAPKPATAVAALEGVRSAHAALSAMVKAKQLTGVHDGSEKMMLAANALATFAKDLPADKRARLEGAIKNLVKALDVLHDAADEGNQANSEKELKAVDGLMTVINAQYPAPTAEKK